MTTRRDFLLAGSAAAATLNLSSCERPNVALPRGARIVVIGAGFAGIGAAGRLQDAGYLVELIEASERIGGRAHSVPLGDFPADLGANWLRVSNNELMPIAEEMNLVSAKSNMQTSAFLKDGVIEIMDASRVEGNVEQALAGPYVRYQAARMLGRRPRARSARELLEPVFAADPTFECTGARLIAGIYAADLKDLSGDILIGGGADASQSADELIEPTVVGGMQALAEALAKPLKPVFGEQARRIKRTDAGVSITTNRRTINADAVIVTTSIGVLKNQGIVFEPGLPKRHKEVLDAMDMGSFAKLWIRYPEAIWSFETDVVGMCGTDEIHGVFDFSKSHDQPVILAYAAGDQGRVLEAMSDEDARTLVHETLKTRLGIALPEPTGFAKNSWSENPLVGGAYMYPNTQYRADDNLRLRAPIADRILLAGEALAENFGYVDTAWSDGRRAADLLIA
ncbi:MAG: NAD(P)/FAD-dependent oxidoreductase [Pseudomonadota bacterium]